MHDKSKALIYILISTLSFSFMGLSIKYIQNIPVFEKVFFRNLVSLFISSFIIIKNNPKNISSFIGKPCNQKLLISRSLLGFAGVILNFYAISNLKLADSQILNRISPVWVAILAAIFLHEKLSKVKIISIIIALIGSVFVIKPEFGFTVLPAVSGFVSSITAAGAYVLVRYLKGKEEPVVIIFYFSTISLILSLPLLLINFITPQFYEFVFLLLTGIFASIGQFGLTHAYKHAPASQVSIYTYTGIIFSSFIGFIVWQEIPDFLSIIGGFFIFVSGYIVYTKSKTQTHT